MVNLILNLFSSNIKNIFYGILFLAVLLFGAWSISNLKEKIALKNENKTLKEAKKTQENILDIYQKHKENSNYILEKLKSDEKEVKTIKSESEADFIKKSAEIFENFDK